MIRLFFYWLFFTGAFCSVCHAENYPRHLSLTEAIYLAVRENPNVQEAQLNQVMQKFALEVQQWQFQPHYSFQVTKTAGTTVTEDNGLTTSSLNVQPAVSLQTPIGTQMTLTSTNNISGHYNPSLSLQVMQPLLRGFGRPIVEAALYNAIDSETISRLNVEGTLRYTVTAVINAYLDVISAIHSLSVDQQALARAQTSVRQTKLFIRAGHKAGVELVTVQADVANAQTRIEMDKNNLQQSRYALLTTIGIDPNTEIEFDSVDVPKLINKFHIPTLQDSKQMILENDIQYQVDNITLNGSTKRNLVAAEDSTRWQLNLTANGTVGNGFGGGRNAGLTSLINGYNRSENATLTLTIPIDDRVAKEAVLNAKIGLREAELALKQEKWAKETSVINGWNTIYSAERTLKFSEDAERLQQKTYQVSFQKYEHGLIDSLELQSAQQQLRAAQHELVAARINYLKALTNLDQLVGNTLKTWNVKVRYS